MMHWLALALVLLPCLAQAGDYTFELTGPDIVTVQGTISFAAAMETDPGVCQLDPDDITAFALTISEASLTLGLSDLQFVNGLECRVDGGKVVAFDLQTTTGNQLQIGNAQSGKIDDSWRLFGTGTVSVSPNNRVTISDVE